MGLAGIWTALYPPRPSSGPRVRFLTEHHILFTSFFGTLFIYRTVFHLVSYINKAFLFTLVFLLIFQSSLWVLYFGIEYEYGL